MKSALVTACLAMVLAACGDDGPARVVVEVLDARNDKAIAGAYAAVERGGLYVTNPDPSRGSPAYVWGARAGSDGRFGLDIPLEDIGVHTFAAGYFYGAQKVAVEEDIEFRIRMEPLGSEAKRPTITNAKLDPERASPGSDFAVSADVQTGDPDDPLSDEVLVLAPHEAASHALDPPSAGVQGKGFPDGHWKGVLRAPRTSGTYTYVLVATTEHCITGDITELKLTVP